MKLVRAPHSYGMTPRAHIAKVDGVWQAFFPEGWPVTQEYFQSFVPWLRRMNGITDWRPTSILHAPVETLQ